MSKVLGRGISALIQDVEFKTENILYIPVEKITVSSYQIRRHFDKNKIRELSESIRKKGVIQPLVVSKKGDKYELIAGERRLRACKIANIKEVPVILKNDLSERDKAELSLIENLQREDLNPYEVAEGYRRLIEEFNITQEELARTLGKSRTVITNFLRLLKYPEYITQSIKDGKISEGHARALMTIKDEKIRRYILKRIIREGLSVREVEEIGKTSSVSSYRKVERRKSKDIFLRDIERQLFKKFGIKVEIKGSYKKGKILIHYFNRKELDRILELFHRRLSD